MAKKRRNIDDFFRQSLPDYELSDAKGNWEFLNHLLHEQDRKRKNRKWIVVILSLSLLLSGGWIVFHLNQQGSSPTIKSEITNQQGSSFNSPEIPIEEKAETLNSGKQFEEKVLEPSTNNHLPESGLNGINNKVNPDQKKQTQNKKKGNVVFRHRQEADIEMSSKAIIQPDPIIRTSLIVDSSQSDINISNPETLSVESQNAPTTEDSIYLQEKDSLNTINTHKEILITKQFLLDSTFASSLPTDSSPLKVDTQIAESANVQAVTPTDVDVKNFNISTGVIVYNTSEAFTNNKNIAPLIGLEYTYHIVQKWSVGLGVWYSPQGGYMLKDTATQETYFFDHIVSQQAIHIHRLHRLYFPLTIYYKLSNAHLMGIGIQPSYLLNTTGNYTEFKHSTTSNSKSQETNVLGYMDGIKPVNFAMHVAYKFELSKRLDLGLRLSYELTSAFEREYFYGINTKPSWGLQALIHFNF